MNKEMTLSEFHKRILHPQNAADKYLKYLWENNGAKSIFYTTGLDVSRLMNDKPDTSGIKINKPNNL